MRQIFNMAVLLLVAAHCSPDGEVHRVVDSAPEDSRFELKSTLRRGVVLHLWDQQSGAINDEGEIKVSPGNADGLVRVKIAAGPALDVEFTARLHCGDRSSCQFLGQNGVEIAELRKTGNHFILSGFAEDFPAGVEPTFVIAADWPELKDYE